MAADLNVHFRHRWPADLAKTPLLQLTVKNRERLLDQIPESTEQGFSKVFADAVKVCRVFGITYLWIDSLCIIQHGDGGKDWTDECKLKSHLIYGSSSLHRQMDG
jgi:hypothetical protein